MTNKLQQLKKTFEALRQALEAAESALIEFEETLEGSPSDRSQTQRGLDLLSIPEVCQELGMGKSWVYQRIRSGEIPSVKLGHNIKVRRKALEEYLDHHSYRPSKDESLEE
jgi:excisionase family DNA binding protein